MTIANESDVASFRDMAERFAKKELEKNAVELDNYPFKKFNEEALKSAHETGLLSVTLPEEYGGVGQGMEVLSAMLMELARADGSFAALVFMNALSLSALSKWADKKVVEKFSSSTLIGFAAYDLPTDLPTELVAEKKDGGYILTGNVEYVTLAPVADAVIVPALLKDSDQTVFFIVDLKTNGVSVSDPVVSLGLRGCPAADINFSNVSVDTENLICEDAATDYPILAANFRAPLAAMSVGVLEGSYQAAKTYAKDRYQGGSMIIEYDMVRQMLVNMAIISESGKALVKTMAQKADEGRPWPISDAGLILLSEQASRATTDGVQCLGGYGYMEDYGQEKRMRDAKQIENIFGAAPLKRMELMEDILRQEE